MDFQTLQVFAGFTSTVSTALMLFWYLRYERGWGRNMLSLEER